MGKDEQMLTVYRHDAHKMRGRSHAAGSRQLAGVTVNQDVPYGADGDAAALSRPNGKPTPTVDDHDTHYRLSLLTGQSRYDPEEFALKRVKDDLESLLAVESAEQMHRAWLTSGLVTAFNESTSNPYTSLKYHTLLVGALVDHYRNGRTFDELALVADSPGVIEPFRTVLATDRFTLRIDTDDAEGGARLGSRPWRSWSSVWSRLPTHPADVGSSKFDMTLDAQLRRIKAWSTALQFIEDFTNWRPDR